MFQRISFLTLAAGALFAAGCAVTPGGGNYHVTAYAPHNPDAVRVDVSIGKQQEYVMEGDRCLMAAACNVGMPGHGTPEGHFRIEDKIPDKRSGSYGFSVSGGNIVPCEAGQCTGSYVGYPMPFWCGFTGADGFHQGYVWPVPRTHGCIRQDKQVAPRFYELVRIGTPVNIAYTQPEDATVGKNVQRPTDYKDPDPPASYMISSAVFQKPPGDLLIQQ